jgi:hypothetical protein
MESIQTYKQSTFAKKFAGALLTTTCLTAASGAVANAATIIEGTLPAPNDFPNTAPGFLLPVATNLVEGSLGVSDPSDWFEFQSLQGGGSFSELATYAVHGQEAGLQVVIYNTAMARLAIGTLEGSGTLLTGTIPGNGDLLVNIDSEAGRNVGYNVSLTANTVAGTPVPVLSAGDSERRLASVLLRSKTERRQFLSAPSSARKAQRFKRPPRMAQSRKSFGPPMNADKTPINKSQFLSAFIGVYRRPSLLVSAYSYPIRHGRDNLPTSFRFEISRKPEPKSPGDPAKLPPAPRSRPSKALHPGALAGLCT